MTKDNQPIYVDNEERFLGRLEKQERFREVLHIVRDSQDDKAPPFIFLIYGEEGMGKSQLTRRLADIAADEALFGSAFQTLQIDWELVRGHIPALQVPHDQIHPEAVLAALYRQAQARGWAEQFEAYQRILKQRQTAEQTVAEALAQEYGQFIALHELGAAGLARLVRLAWPVGELGQKQKQALHAAGLRLEVEQAVKLRQQADRFLKTHLKPKLYDVYRQPHEQLAWALGQGFRRVSHDRPLVLAIDAYEIVASAADIWIRTVIKSAGPSVIWIIAGRDNLADSRPGHRYLGYNTEFTRRLIVWDIQPLAIKYVSACLLDLAPKSSSCTQGNRRHSSHYFG